MLAISISNVTGKIDWQSENSLASADLINIDTNINNLKIAVESITSLTDLSCMEGQYQNLLPELPSVPIWIWTGSSFSGGSVGIGITNPGSKLSIIGLPTSSTTGSISGDIWIETVGGKVLKIVP